MLTYRWESLYRTRPNKKDIPLNRAGVAFFGHKSTDGVRLAMENLRSTFSRKYQTVDEVCLPTILGQPFVICENRIVSKSDQVASGALDQKLPSYLDPKGLVFDNLLKSNKNRYVEDNGIVFAKVVPSLKCAQCSYF